MAGCDGREHRYVDEENALERRVDVRVPHEPAQTVRVRAPWASELLPGRGYASVTSLSGPTPTRCSRWKRSSIWHVRRCDPGP